MSTPLLHVDQLVKRFGGLAATDHATLQVKAGEIHALIGPNGAGKTTLIHQISGALAPDEGRIVFDGSDLTHTAMHQRARLGLVRSYQITSVFTRLTVQDNLALAIQAGEGSSFQFWRAARSEHARYGMANNVSWKWAWPWPLRQS
jgi:branched-chain amino acid transport system ATP-binding protein